MVKDTYFDAAGNPEHEVTVINLNKPDTGWILSVFSTPAEFQFYISTIRRVELAFWQSDKTKFQFYISTIRSVNPAEQYLISSISILHKYD